MLIRRLVLLSCCVLAVAVTDTSLFAWGQQGHRLVALVAANHLSAIAKQNVSWMLGRETLGDIASWADDYRRGVVQTGPWHYVNIPATAKSYDRDRDCPTQPGVMRGSRDDMWRDCIIDRLRYNEERLADARLDRADRAIALKFVVHLVGDIHQPLHASAIEAGGNGIRVKQFGSENCGSDPARPVPCNLHSAWDVGLIMHRNLDDRAFLAVLERRLTSERLLNKPVGTPADWAMESLTISNAIMLPQQGSVDEAYYTKGIGNIEERLALAGARLAQVLNRALTARPPA
jgi:hypothetical protein